MGYQVLRHRLNSTRNRYPSGDFRFDNMTANLQSNGQPVPRTGNTFAGFLLGYVRSAQFSKQVAAWHPRATHQALYFQDDWKFSPTLTLNLGVRYTNATPFTTQYGQHTQFDPTAVDPLSKRIGALVHPGKPLSRRDNNNFAPRLGVAWHPWQKWVFRGGFAVATAPLGFPVQDGNFQEYEAVTNYEQLPGDPRPIYRISQIPTAPTFTVQPDGTAPYVGSNFSARTAEWWDPNLRDPYVMNWNFTIQRELTANYLLDLTYQGSGGVGLIENWEYNAFPIDLGANDRALRNAAFAAPQNYRPFPHFGSIRLRSNFGHSTHHAGTVKLEKRFSRGFNFVTFYTFSKTLDSQDTDNSGTGVAPVNNRGLEKGRAGFDRNHRFVGSVLWELPMGRGKKYLNRGGWWNHIVGGYEIAWIQTLESGNPLNFSFANSPFNYFPDYIGARRPNVVKADPGLRDNWRDFGGARFDPTFINPIISIDNFAYPAEFTPGNLGRGVVTGTPLTWGQVSAQKNIQIRERFRFQVRWDFQNFMKTYAWSNISTAVDFQNPRTFGKVRSEPRTAEWGGQPIMHLTLALYF